MCQEKEQDLSVNESGLPGLEGTEKTPQTEKGQLDPEEPSRKVKCVVPVHIRYTLKRAVPARNPNQFSRTARESDYWLLAAESVECLDRIK